MLSSEKTLTLVPEEVRIPRCIAPRESSSWAKVRQGVLCDIPLPVSSVVHAARTVEYQKHEQESQRILCRHYSILGSPWRVDRFLTMESF